MNRFLRKFTKSFKENLSDIILALLAFLSLFPYWSFFSIGFFILNFIYFKKRVRICWAFFSIAIFVNIIFFIFIKPNFDKFDKEVTRLGFHQEAKKSSLLKLNYYNKEIIEYKNKNGKYPDRLSDIQNGNMDFKDESFVVSNIDKNNLVFAYYYYEKVSSNKYYLLGIGSDGEPKTDDDILPTISVEDTITTGLIRFAIKDNNKTKLTIEDSVEKVMLK